MPCSNCVAFRKEDVCIYQGHPPLNRRLPDTSRLSHLPQVYGAQSPTTQLIPSGGAVSTGIRHLAGEDIHAIKSKIKQLENELSDVTARLASQSVPTAGSSTELSSSLLGDGVQIQDELSIHGQPQEISHGLMHKTRLFGQSHWMNGVAPVRLSNIFS